MAQALWAGGVVIRSSPNGLFRVPSWVQDGPDGDGRKLEISFSVLRDCVCYYSFLLVAGASRTEVQFWFGKPNQRRPDVLLALASGLLLFLSSRADQSS